MSIPILKHACFVRLLEKCKMMSELKQIHALLIILRLSNKQPFTSRILSFIATSNSCNIHYANQFFLQISNPTIDCYNMMIRGYSSSKSPSKSICLLVEMLRSGVVPDYLTYPFIAKASARLSDLRLGGCIHAATLQNGFVSDRFVSNSLIHMYGSCGDIRSARKLFNEIPSKNSVSWNTILDGYAKAGNLELMKEVFNSMPERDVVSWSALIDGYVKNGEYTEALKTFDQMKGVGPKANEVTMVSVLCACAHLGALEHGRMMHRYVVENGLPLTLALRTSIVDMYAKCGAIGEAFDVFHGVPRRKTDVLIWNAMIGGLASHGFIKESFDMYIYMQSFGIQPDEITYLCLLTACVHGGLVDRAWYFFESLGKDGMVPKAEHYACMVDVLARAGQLLEAYKFLCNMPIEPTSSMLGALLNGCMNHGDLHLAEVVGKKLIEMEPDHDGRYIGLSNVYAIGSRWAEARTMREVMEMRGLKKIPGFSFVEIHGTLNRFIAHEKAHPKCEQIYMLLDVILAEMRPKTDTEMWELISFIHEDS